MAFAKFLGADINFYDIKRKDQIIAFLDTKIKDSDLDPDSKWITTWNDYLGDIKYFLRWSYNCKILKEKNDEAVVQQPSEWETPTIAAIKKKKTKRLSPYSESQIWERDELQATDMNHKSAIRPLYLCFGI